MLAKCNLCKQTVSYKTSTTKLKKHLARKHPLVKLNYEDSTTQGTNVVSNQIRAENINTARPGPSISTPSNLQSNQEAEDTEPGPSTSNNSNIKRETSQTKLPFMPKTISIHTKKKLDKCLMDLFTEDLQPFSIVEDRGFKNFVQMLNPSYQLPIRCIKYYVTSNIRGKI
ncbi:unnamed protein product [Ceutorhynchus assimilis]|uniref:BED-type domain-containing protein n=1 Tax=Ceutorhynchus assimilis TaxID=467358 RepID=A0A9N9MY98_9CUCU|nr:unnamed protein product [Ceutorhynchus assimilis]